MNRDPKVTWRLSDRYVPGRDRDSIPADIAKDDVWFLVAPSVPR
jgi:hypothetical protein